MSLALERSGRIALFIPTLAGGGAERVVLNLARGFVELGHSVELIVCRADGAYRHAVPAGVELVELKVLRSWSAVAALARHLRRRPVELLFAAMDTANLIALAARALARVPTRVVVAIHNTLSQELTATRRGRAHVPLARMLYPRAAGVVAVSQGSADDAAALLDLPARRITVIENPVVTPELHAQAAARLDDPWLAQGAHPVILGCGRLTPQKDFANLIRAFRFVRVTRNARLVILGEGEERAALEALVRDSGLSGHVRLPGFVANPFAWMARSAVFALSSRHEGSPLVLVEALACGARIAATDCPSGPREILDGVASARLVPPGDPTALGRAIVELLDTPPAPAAHAIARFDYRHAAKAYLELARAGAR